MNQANFQITMLTVTILSFTIPLSAEPPNHPPTGMGVAGQSLSGGHVLLAPGGGRVETNQNGDTYSPAPQQMELGPMGSVLSNLDNGNCAPGGSNLFVAGNTVTLSVFSISPAPSINMSKIMTYGVTNTTPPRFILGSVSEVAPVNTSFTASSDFPLTGLTSGQSAFVRRLIFSPDDNAWHELNSPASSSGCTTIQINKL